MTNFLNKINQAQLRKIRNSKTVFGLILGQKRNGTPVLKLWSNADSIFSQKWGTGLILFAVGKRLVEEDVDSYDEVDEEDFY